MRKPAFPFSTALPAEGRGQRYSGGRSRGQQHRATLALAVACSVVPIKVATINFLFTSCARKKENRLKCMLNICIPRVTVVARKTGITVRPLSVVGAVALACLVVTVSLEWVTVAITLTRNTASATC